MRKRPENDIQRMIVKYIQAVLPHGIVMAIPNGSRRTANGRPMNAAPGLLPGAPDLVVVLPKAKVLWLEVKAPKGRVSSHQIFVHGKLNSLGHVCAVVRSIDDVQRAFDHLGIETREIRNYANRKPELDEGNGTETDYLEEERHVIFRDM